MRGFWRHYVIDFVPVRGEYALDWTSTGPDGVLNNRHHSAHLCARQGSYIAGVRRAHSRAVWQGRANMLCMFYVACIHKISELN